MPQKRKTTRLTLLLAMLLWWGALISPAQAAVINAAGCSQANVQSAINSASNGDIVVIPTGTCTWTSGITLAKKIMLQGAGIGSTIITYAGGTLFVASGESANNIRITGVEFQNCTQCIYFDGDGSPKEAMKNFRIDHCKFKNADVALETDGHATGVLDHNTFEDSYGARIYGGNQGGATFPFVLGSSDAVFFEDNTITVNAGVSVDHFIASNSGSKYVVRHNNYTYNASLWNIIDAHGYCEVAGRGSFTWEVYDNTFTLPPSLDAVMHLRGGQGVVYNNNFNSSDSGPDWAIHLTDYMTCSPPCVDTCSGYPCKDQINHSYFWNNKNNGTPLNVTNDCPAVLQENRDYYNSQMPGYAPYTYPHPLAGATDSPLSAPGNLRRR